MGRDALKTARGIVAGFGPMRIGSFAVCFDVDRLLPDDPDRHPTGIVAVADLTEVCSASLRSESLACDCGLWAMPGQRHWRFTNIRTLDRPVPCRGAQQMWYPPAEVVGLVEAQLDARAVLAAAFTADGA